MEHFATRTAQNKGKLMDEEASVQAKGYLGNSDLSSEYPCGS